MIFRSRQSAPTDGRDQSTNQYGQSIFLTSKQNSDAKGMFYQWGHKEPFTFATNSETWGTDAMRETGKYPVKIYTIDGVLIYQEYRGDNNKEKQPVGGVIISFTSATSMMETVKNPIIFYRGNSVINQVGYTKDLWDYYWTSHSRGTDGFGYPGNNPNWHNIYLDVYVSKRLKSIYDPCPYGFRIPSNGVWNKFKFKMSWIDKDYLGGNSWTMNTSLSWFTGLGWRISGLFGYTGRSGYYRTTTVGSNQGGYIIDFYSNEKFTSNRYDLSQVFGYSVRCIDFVSPPRPTDETLVATS